VSAFLAARGVSKAYGGLRVLHDVDVEVRANEVLGLIGENGAGKSTLMRILAGTVRPSSGSLSLDGEPLRLHGAQDAAEHGIGMVFQEQSLLLNMSVAENIYLGQEGRFIRFGTIMRGRLHKAARAQLEKIGVDIDVGARTSELSFAARQMVELAKCLTLEDRTRRQLLILLDEPTSVLNQAEVEMLFSRIRALRTRASFVFVSHRLNEVLRVSDRTVVMKDGRVVGEHSSGEVAVSDLHRQMVGRSLQTEYYKEASQVPPRHEVLLRTHGLQVAGQFHDVDLALHAGEVVGIAGVLGSGKEEVTRCLGGFQRATAGRIEVGGMPARLRSPQEAVRRGIGTIPRERRVEGLVMFLSIAANISLPSLERVMRGGVLIDYRREREVAQHWLERLRIKAPDVDVACRKLSGGNQQKVVLARWMTAGSRILVLDHPTRGLDVGAKEEVYELIRELSAAGIAILLISDTLEELIGLSHTVLVMRDGTITARFDAAAGSKPAQVDLVRHMV